ncbi:BPSL0067 family protein [Patescibacteria group bacterium]|nr:BPSL0067 family protein [Patescibacteria group bacterium]MBU4580431.1 BPSL0067 family protein [Patescibacteria group bacterium]
MAMFAMAAPAQALQDLTITDNNLKGLMWWTTWTPYGSDGGDLAVWPGSFETYGASKTLLYIGSIRAIKIGDGECVAFAKAMSNTNNIASSNWRRGINVMSTTTYIPRGTLVATFFGSNGGYSGHVAIFGGYIYDLSGNRNGIFVWDQNYLPNHGNVVARHFIRTSGTGVNNANNYYVVQVP